jgi:hypothetical protein
MESEIEEIIISEYQNKGGFRLQIIAQIRGAGITNIRYIIRILKPDKTSIDYMTDLNGFMSLGQILLALHEFAKFPLYANAKSIEKLRELLTEENIKTMSKILKMTKPPKS